MFAPGQRPPPGVNLRGARVLEALVLMREVKEGEVIVMKWGEPTAFK